MPRVFRVITGLVVALVVLAFPLAAQSGTIRGDIRDSSGTLLPGVVVLVENTTIRGSSNSRGHYELRGVPTGTHTLRARLIGYQPMSIVVSVVGGEQTQDFTLVQSPFQMAPIDVVVVNLYPFEATVASVFRIRGCR